MKNFIYYFLLATFIFVFINCEKKSPEPDEINFLAYQAPFANDTVAVKLKEIFIDNELNAKFSYDKGQLKTINRYIFLDSLRVISEISINHNENHLEDIFTKRPKIISVEDHYISPEWIDLHSLKVEKLATDSVISLDENQYFSEYKAKWTYKFSLDGIIKERAYLVTGAPAYDWKESYFRDKFNNVTLCVKEASKAVGNPVTASIVYFEYDSNPNPFFHTGINGSGQIGLNVLSPNNITKSTMLLENGLSLITEYKYVYNSNGYPKSVTITEKTVGQPNENIQHLSYTYF